MEIQMKTAELREAIRLINRFSDWGYLQCSDQDVLQKLAKTFKDLESAVGALYATIEENWPDLIWRADNA
ncbi:MAG: hypothetical protein IPP13_21540 [Kouleothrix sp.]|jgi:hypothetical protein|nr:hypothetical protein [Kouleothrix sp.]